MAKPTRILRRLGAVLILPAILLSTSFAATAASEVTGHVMFVAGDASIVRDGKVLAISSGSELNVGDALLTGPTGTVQLKTSVGDRLALFGNSELLIERYSAARGTRHYRLLNGAVRSITGKLSSRSIEGTGYIEGTGGIDGTGYIEGTGDAMVDGIEGTGKPLAFIEGTGDGISGLGGTVAEGEYRLFTPLGSIRVYGTDYTVALCGHERRRDIGSGECELPVVDTQLPKQPATKMSLPALYVAVSNGSIGLGNSHRELRIASGSFAVQDGIEGTGKKLLRPPAIFARLGAQASDGEASGPKSKDGKPAEDSGSVASRLSGTVISRGGASEPGQVTSSSESVMMTRGLAAGFTNFTAAGSVSQSDLATDSNGDLTMLKLDTRRYDIGTASNLPPPAEPPRGGNGLIWGRWMQGIGNEVSSSGSSRELNFEQNSLHWIVGPETVVGGGAADFARLPTTGTATYGQFGRTTPTDNRGNVGEVTNSTLSINFDVWKVQTSVSASFGAGTENWVATGGEGAITLDGTGSQLLFAGEYANTTVNGATVEGSEFTGVLTVPGAIGGAPPAAGLIYRLGNRVDQTIVNGALLFELDN